MNQPMTLQQMRVQIAELKKHLHDAQRSIALILADVEGGSGLTKEEFIKLASNIEINGTLIKEDYSNLF